MSPCPSEQIGQGGWEFKGRQEKQVSSRRVANVYQIIRTTFSVCYYMLALKILSERCGERRKISWKAQTICSRLKAGWLQWLRKKYLYFKKRFIV
jgi:hypothetical protein